MNPSVGPVLELDPIFIVGILPRSGTNFLYQLLSLHPDCQVGGVIWEDFLLAHADLIVRYAETVQKHWDQTWAVQDRLGQPVKELCRCVGKGLISFLQLQVYDESEAQVSGGSVVSGSKRLVTKTPSVKNLQHFSKIFPDAQLIIVIRDGRALVESGVRSFNWGYDQATRAWADAARTIIQFDKDPSKGECKYLITKFEDLVHHTEWELRRIFSFLALDPHKYNFRAAASTPVIGSCELRRTGEREIHWNPIERTQDFNPVDRASKWGRRMHERFNWIAGDELEQIGYLKKNPSRNRLLWNLWNIALDAKFALYKARTSRIDFIGHSL
jgi:hypothetical protein